MAGFAAFNPKLAYFNTKAEISKGSQFRVTNIQDYNWPTFAEILSSWVECLDI